MPGSIFPLPVVLQEDDQKAYDALKAPKSIVVRYGYLKMVGEFPYDGDAKPGCGSKLVVRTPRGIELGEMLTTTCGNGGCGKSVSRKQMLEYIENSGGRDYPFTNQGKVVRVATIDDLNEQSKLDGEKPAIIKAAKQHILDLNLKMKLVDVEILLTRERILFHYTSEDWVDFRELVRILAGEFHARIEMHQVSARDEARIVADYEKCGQHCCCKQFLKVLKPISMRSAKVQKATLDPTKISGRCGRLMCCLRYEDETYEDLRKRLPHRKSRVITPDGFGTVMDSQILTQLALVQMDDGSGTAAYPIESLKPLPKDQDPGAPAPREPFVPRGKGGPAGPGPGNAPQNRQDRGPRPDRGGDRGGDRGPDREREPRRPMPGNPLNENEIESKEGAPLDHEIDGPQIPQGERPQERQPERQQDRPQNRNQDRGPNRNQDRGQDNRNQDRRQGQDRNQGQAQDRGQSQKPSGDGRPQRQPFRSIRNQPPAPPTEGDQLSDPSRTPSHAGDFAEGPMDNLTDDMGPDAPGDDGPDNPGQGANPSSENTGNRRRRRRGRGGRGGGGNGGRGPENPGSPGGPIGPLPPPPG